MKRKTVFIGLSGGVDSAVAAYILSKHYRVTGVHLRNLETDTSNNAKTVAEQLNIPFLVWDTRKQFEDNVINDFKKALASGYTPNPCINCNEKIKFGLFADKYLYEGADFISTGHYARIDEGKLLRGSDPTKDQSYFLYRINSKILSKTIFPLGDMTKSKVKKIANKIGLKAIESKESQDICFMENQNIREFIKKNLKENPGKIVDYDTKEEIGEHSGIHFYTIGQREGIKIGGTDKPYYVVDKDVKKNILYVGKGKHHPMLWKKEISISDESWIYEKPLIDKVYLSQIRYGQEPIKCRYSKGRVSLDKPVFAPASGQSVVIYNNNQVLGGGIIK